MKSYISVHDVTPDNLHKIELIINILKYKFNISKICILVIPGLDWTNLQIQKLILWQKEGIEMAAHGWKHKSVDNKTFYHKLHSIVMSANCAEHLSKDRQNVFRIMENSYNWFVENGFKKPLLYVPPAWAMGKIKKIDLSKLDFTHYECTTGMIHNQKYRFLPLLGFEERNTFKALLRRFFNSLNYLLAYFTGIIRIAIHPNDFHLHLRQDAFKYLSRSKETLLLNELS